MKELIDPNDTCCSLCERPMDKRDIYEHVRLEHETIFLCMMELIKEAKKL